MAIGATYNKRQEELARTQAPVGSRQPYNGMNGVSENTANNLGNYQQGYRPSEQVTAAQQNLQRVQAQKPQNYASKYGAQLDSLLDRIQNPEQFKYSFDGDEMFKYYADLYTQKGKQASMDAMGQAAALTGGYGNSYAQQVGQQGYQQYLLSLYDRGMDMRDRAYQQHQDNLANQQNAYQMMAAADATDYGRHRDDVGDWQNELAYATERADTERGLDLDQYRNDLNYWTGIAQAEAAAAEGQRQFDAGMDLSREQLAQSRDEFNRTSELNWAKLQEDQRQFDAGMDAQEKENNRKVAIDYVGAILSNGQIPSNELLVAAGLSYEDAMKLIAQATGGGGGGGSGSSNKGDQGSVYYQDMDGRYYKYKDGKRFYVLDSAVKDTDLVHNETVSAAQRRMSNQPDAKKEATKSDVLAEWLKKGINNYAKKLSGGN